MHTEPRDILSILSHAVMLGSLRLLCVCLALLMCCAPVMPVTDGTNDGSSGMTRSGRLAIIKKGSPAPFDGVLYDDEAFADQRARHQRDKEMLKLEAERDLDVQGIRLRAATATTGVSLQACRDEKERIYDIKDERIRSLEKELAGIHEGKAWWENALWFGLGAAAVLGGAWAMGQVAD